MLGIACVAWTVRETACLVAGARVRRRRRTSVLPCSPLVIEIGPGDAVRPLGQG